MASRKLWIGVAVGVVGVGAVIFFFSASEQGREARGQGAEHGQVEDRNGIEHAKVAQQENPVREGTAGKKGGPSAAKPHGTGGNPKARRIRAALDTPAHAFLAKTSPAWVQTRKVLRSHGELEWAEKLDDLLEDISKARRDLELEGEFLLGRQNAILESLWNTDFSADLKAEIRGPLDLLAERIEAYEN